MTLPSILQFVMPAEPESPKTDGTKDPKNAEFPSTSWSEIEDLNGSVTQADKALESLCRKYWYPVYAFLRMRGHGFEDAQDVTQGFFAYMLKLGSFSDARREKGRLRNFLLKAVKNYEANWFRSRRTKKAGGEFEIVSYEWLAAEKRFSEEPKDIDSPDYLFDRRWATIIFENSLKQLREEYVSRGKKVLFDTLSVYLDHASIEPSRKGIAEELGMTIDAVHMAVWRLRERRRQLLRLQIAETVNSVDDIDSEISELIGIFSAR